MADPLDALRAPVTPADPDPGFAARLRARLKHALALPEGVAVTETSLTLAEREPPAPAEERGAAIPYLAVRAARDALDWYARVLGARLRGEPIVMPDGRVGHAELELAHGVIYLADEHPEIGVTAPAPGGVPVSLVLDVADVDAVIAAAVEAGARLDRRPYEAYGHRNATVTDPYGHRWLLQAPLPGATAGPAGAAPLRQGDISYASLWVRDVARAAAFYGAVLGLEYVPAHGNRGRQAPGLAPPQGLWEHPAPSTLFCSYAVDDIAAAVARVRAAGGQAEEPVPRAYGLSADCVDTDGVRFALHQQLARTPAAAEPPASAAGHDGDLVYVTLEVPDAARTLEFYGSVLGWRSHQGRTPGGWQVEGTTPMIGISGGHAAPAAVPVWQVSDLAAAVVQVRAAGGTSTEPHREPYGLMAECADDQGVRFSLGQFP
jgi:predicted enzyme related to lactoylglutathione lyase